jgi:hypothetical protein
MSPEKRKLYVELSITVILIRDLGKTLESIDFGDEWNEETAHRFRLVNSGLREFLDIVETSAVTTA